LSPSDLAARLAHLTAERSALQGAIDLAQEDYDDAEKRHALTDTDFVDAELLEQEIYDAEMALAQWDTDNGGELAALQGKEVRKD
jgi:hypothetical protein